MLPEPWDKVARTSLHGKGLLTCKTGASCECDIDLSQLFNGRLVVRVIPLNSEDPDPSIFRRCEYFDFIGTLDDNLSLSVKNIRFTRRILSKEDLWTGSWRHEGYVHLPGSVRFFRPGKTSSASDMLICELTNLSLGRERDPVEASVSGFRIRLSSCARNLDLPLIEALRTSGILCQMEITGFDEGGKGHLDKFVWMLCDLLGLASRSPVSCVSRRWQNAQGLIVDGYFREPTFDSPVRVGPLIEPSSLAGFIQETFASYEEKWKNWDIANAMDHYIQAMAVSSAWSQALGFFTALETIRAAFLKQQNNGTKEYYVCRRQFDKARIPQQVLKLLGDHLSAFSELTGDEETSLLGYIRGMNRRAYKVVLKDMFRELEVIYEDDELKRLVDLRNQIIHGGSPDYSKGKWRNTSDAFLNVVKFASLVERVLLAILGYRGTYNPYDRSVAILGQEDA